MNSLLKSSISDMPELILCKIFGFLDFREIQTMRKVSKSLRNFIDDVRPDSRILEISIEENSEIKNLEIRYKIEFQTFSVKYGISENLKTGISDLNLILKNQKSILETFIIKKLSNFRFTEFLKIPLNLKINEFLIETENEEKILETLTIFKISKLRIYSLEESPKIFKIEKLVKSENWKHLEEISIEGCQISSEFLRHFLNFSKVSIDLEDVEAEDVIYLKENLLESSKFKKFTLFYTKLLNVEQLYDSLGPPDSDSNFFGFVKFWKFPFPESSDYLELSIMEFEMPKVVFTRCSE